MALSVAYTLLPDNPAWLSAGLYGKGIPGDVLIRVVFLVRLAFVYTRAEFELFAGANGWE